jgi:DNA processing protein
MVASVGYVSVPDINSVYTFALAFSVGLGDRSALKFYRCFPHYEDWRSSSDEQRVKLRNELGPRARLDVFSMNWERVFADACSQIERNTRQGSSVLTIGDDAYPELLRLIPDPPLVLFVKGNSASLSAALPVAVVGTRNPTERGQHVASRISRSLASRGCCILSGLAVGIDTAAHNGALEGSGQTVAVFGTPLDKIYPADNKELAGKILDSGGAWVSETPAGGSTHRNSFILRDRIQSGLSAVVIPVQTDVVGGTMHTVKFARQHSRLLFCPRPIAGEEDKPQYGGIHELLKSGVAKPFNGDGYEEIVHAAGERRRALLRGDRFETKPDKVSDDLANGAGLAKPDGNGPQLNEGVRKTHSKSFGQFNLF